MYYSTNHKAARATLRKAVIQGLAEDRGLYMPEIIKQMPQAYWEELSNLSFQESSYRVAEAFFGDEVPEEALKKIVYDTLAFDTPLVQVEKNIYSLELFHGPTLAFKDVGARFMARLLQYFIHLDKETESNKSTESELVNVLVATSGDTGSAVANGFLGVEGIHVYVLYPKGKVSPIQECQFTTLGQNITALEVDGTFDDCQRLVKTAFMDAELNKHMRLTSANSINVARFLPQAFYYFWAYAQLLKKQKENTQSSAQPQSAVSNLVFCVPSGNFGNLCAGLFGYEMGLPVKHFIAANNANDVVYKYLETGQYSPIPSIQTIANAMDVGDPSNFARIMELVRRRNNADEETSYTELHPMMKAGGLLTGATYTDEQIADTMRDCYARTGYILDPHGACAYQALRDQLQDDEIGVFLETAHPAKFKQTADNILGADIPIPERLQAFMKGQKQSLPISSRFEDFKALLLKR